MDTAILAPCFEKAFFFLSSINLKDSSTKAPWPLAKAKRTVAFTYFPTALLSASSPSLLAVVRPFTTETGLKVRDSRQKITLVLVGSPES